jgi:hypothetical protein
LIEFQPKSRKTDIASLEIFITKKKAIVFVISDFMSRLRANVENCIKKHDITAYVYDIREEKMPDLGMVSMLDAETAVELINTSAKAVRMN